MVVVNQSSSTLSVFRNTSTPGSISFAPKVDIAASAAALSVAIGDLDNDGKPDLAVANNLLSVYRNISSPGTITFGSKVDFVTGTSPDYVAIADLDGNGRLDVALSTLVA